MVNLRNAEVFNLRKENYFHLGIPSFWGHAFDY